MALSKGILISDEFSFIPFYQKRSQELALYIMLWAMHLNGKNLSVSSKKYIFIIDS